MKRILVGVDGSPESAAAAQKAAELAKAFNAQLSLAYVVPHHLPSGAAVYSVEARRGDLPEQSYVAALLLQAELGCRPYGVVAETTTRTGPVAETLADMAEAGGFDLVVVGHRGQDGVRRALLGSVADRLVQISSRPVLVVR